MNTWRTATVAELQRKGILLVEDGNHGEYRPRSDEFVERGIAFIRAADMDAGQIKFDDCSYINERARQRITKGIGAPGDVLLSHKGTVGKIALASDDAPAFVCSPQTTFWRSLDTQTLDRRYLHVFLRSPMFHAQLESRAGETDMAPYVSLTAQRAFSVILPPIDIQQSIALIVGTLDDKIELNRRMNATLEIMARAIFKDWFVDFGPTRAKMEGRAPYLATEIWAVFPQKLDGENKPNGWIASTIGDQVTIVGGTTPSTKVPTYWNGDLHWATPKDMSSLSAPVLLDTERKITPLGVSQIGSGLLPVGSVLLSSRAPIGYLAINAMPTAINQGFIGMVCDRRVSNVFVWLWTMANMEIVHQKANGSTFQEISKSNFRPIPLTLPSEAALAAFDAMVQPLFKRICANEMESRTLAATRDLILPKLMSGEIRVKDAERELAAVA